MCRKNGREDPRNALRLLCLDLLHEERAPRHFQRNPDNLIPQLLTVCRTVDENIGIVPPSDKGDFKTELYEIPTLDCAACAVKLEKLVNRQPGVLSASISFATKTMKLTAKDPDSLIPELTKKMQRSRKSDRDPQETASDQSAEKGKGSQRSILP